MFSKIKEVFIGKYLGSIIRHVLGWGGGFLIGIGIDPETVANFTQSGQEVLMGVVMFLVAQGWSFGEKAKKPKE